MRVVCHIRESVQIHKFRANSLSAFENVVNNWVEKAIHYHFISKIRPNEASFKTTEPNPMAMTWFFSPVKWTDKHMNLIWRICAYSKFVLEFWIDDLTFYLIFVNLFMTFLSKKKTLENGNIFKELFVRWYLNTWNSLRYFPFFSSIHIHSSVVNLLVVYKTSIEVMRLLRWFYAKTGIRCSGWVLIHAKHLFSPSNVFEGEMICWFFLTDLLLFVMSKEVLKY